jgi:hypothetical protein
MHLLVYNKNASAIDCENILYLLKDTIPKDHIEDFNAEQQFLKSI